MTDSDAEFRNEIRAVVRRHDPDPSELRSLSDDLDALAERFEATEDAL